MRLTGQFKLLGFTTNIDRDTAEIKGQNLYVITENEGDPKFNFGSKVEEYYYAPQNLSEVLTEFDPKKDYSLTIEISEYSTKEGKKVFKRLIAIK